MPTSSRRLRPLSVAILGLVGALTVGAVAEAQDRRVPRSQAEARLSYAPIVKRVAPAVVNVYVRRRVRRRMSPFIDDPWFRQFFDRGFGIPRERVQNSLGSGVIVSPDGVVFARGGPEYRKWHPAITAKTGKLDGGWTVEAAIPMADFGLRTDTIPDLWGLTTR